MNWDPVLLRDEDHLRLLMIGKTGSGKSATGNTMFDKSVFLSKTSSSPVTKTCQPHTDAVSNRRVTVIDTPDFSNSDSEMKKALELCSLGAHVILLILSLSTFTEQEMKVVNWFEQMFGSEALRYTLVIFTRADNITNSQLRSLVRRNNELSGFINRCGWRVCGMNNKDRSNRRQVTKLMEKIDRLVSENTNICYTLEMLQETERRRQEKERREEEERKRAEEERREEEERKEREHQVTLDTVRIETEIRVRRECEEQERAEKLEEQKKAEKSEKRLSVQQMNKYVCTMIVWGLATGVLVWRKDSLHRWPIMRGFIITAGSATTGLFTGVFWSLLWKSPFVKVFSSHWHPSAARQFLMKTAGVMHGAFAGAVWHYFVGDNRLLVSVLSGAAGALLPIQRSS